MPVDCAEAQFSCGLAKEETELPKLRVYVLYKKRKGGGNFFGACGNWAFGPRPPRQKNFLPARSVMEVGKFFCYHGLHRPAGSVRYCSECRKHSVSGYQAV